jgi:hypothetical protein
MRDAKTSWIYEDVLHTQLATEEVFRVNSETAAYIVFSMSHLKVAFCFLALGYLLSTIIITAELLLSRYIHHEYNGVHSLETQLLVFQPLVV